MHVFSLPSTVRTKWCFFIVSDLFSVEAVFSSQPVILPFYCIDDGTLPVWSTRPAPSLAINYWRLKEDAVMRDVILAIRADEAHHRVVNHTLSSIHLNEKNPFSPGQKKL
nr:uncharacterized protein LOC131775835 [Pocillopora verrucosa]